MAFIAYLLACLVFIAVCLAMLWPIGAASRRVRKQIQQLRAAKWHTCGSDLTNRS